MSKSFAPFVAALALATVLPAAASAASDGSEQARRVIDLSVPANDMVQRLTLSDGSQLFGHVQSIADDSIVFRSIAGVVMDVRRIDIADLRVVNGRVVAGEFQQIDPHNTRLMFAPTARSLRRGEGYFGLHQVFLPFVQVGLTDRVSIGGGTPLLFFGDGPHPFWFTPKVQLASSDKAAVAAGLIHITALERDAGIAYGVTTVGPADRAVSIGLGYAYSGNDRSPILMVGGEYRSSRRIKWITENWLWRGGDGFMSGGIRFIGERLSADVSLVAPLVEDTFVMPVVSFAWHF